MKTDVVKLVTFQLGLDLFAADVLSVDRVLRYTPPNAVPDVPAWIEGVVEHRGDVIPVVDLRRRVELSDDSITPETRMLVLQLARRATWARSSTWCTRSRRCRRRTSRRRRRCFAGSPRNSFAASRRCATNSS